jgi:hypothetical protein
MANNKNPNQKQPGEKEPGKFHFNPGNQSGKTVESFKDESERRPTETGYKAVASNEIKSADQFEFAKQAQEGQVAIVASYEFQRPDQTLLMKTMGLPQRGVD